MEQERPCAVKNCPNTLSEWVPIRITICSDHQYLELEKKRLVKGLVERFDLSADDKEFLSLNIDDNSHLYYASVLARYLSIKQVTFFGYTTKGRILAEKQNKRWFIPAEEAARVIDLVRNWISIREAAAIAKTSRCVLASLALEGHFGPVCRNLRGILAIRKEYLPFLETECRKLKIARRKWANRTGRHLVKGEVGVSEVADRFRVSTTTIHNRIRAGKIKAKKRMGWYAIKL